NVTHTGEIWLQIAGHAAGAGASSEDVTISYGTANASQGDSGIGGINWGAENRTGTSGANIASAPANGSEYKVKTAPPVAGGTVAIPFDVTSKRAGTYHSDATLTSDQTNGSTVSSQTITVTP